MFLRARLRRSLANRSWPHPLQVTPVFEARNTNRLTSIVTPSSWEFETRFLFHNSVWDWSRESNNLPGLRSSPQSTLHTTGEINDELKQSIGHVSEPPFCFRDGELEVYDEKQITPKGATKIQLSQ